MCDDGGGGGERRENKHGEKNDVIVVRLLVGISHMWTIWVPLLQVQMTTFASS